MMPSFSDLKEMSGNGRPTTSPHGTTAWCRYYRGRSPWGSVSCAATWSLRSTSCCFTARSSKERLLRLCHQATQECLLRLCHRVTLERLLRLCHRVTLECLLLPYHRVTLEYLQLLCHQATRECLWLLYHRVFKGRLRVLCHQGTQERLLLFYHQVTPERLLLPLPPGHPDAHSPPETPPLGSAPPGNPEASSPASMQPAQPLPHAAVSPPTAAAPPAPAATLPPPEPQPVAPREPAQNAPSCCTKAVHCADGRTDTLHMRGSNGQECAFRPFEERIRYSCEGVRGASWRQHCAWQDVCRELAHEPQRSPPRECYPGWFGE
ncbi:hypothetical protein MRX96_029532 [Rhipicephalus microplus]